MKKEHILMTQIVLEESFSDVALYSGILYTWKNPKTLHLYDWNEWMDHIFFGNLPIYQNPFPFQKISSQIDDLQKYFMKEIIFEKDIRDFFVYNHILYYIDQEGFFALAPESADVKPQLLAKGNFYFLSLSDRNRVVLSGGEMGVFEYFLSNKWNTFSEENNSSSNFFQWDNTPTYSTKWDGHNLLQLDANEEPVQLIEFHLYKHIIQIENKKQREQLKQQSPYYNESLNLDYKEDTHNWDTLFQYLSVNETKGSHSLDAFKNPEIPVAIQPSPFFERPLLDDHTLYIEETENGLNLTMQSELYLYIPHADYIKWSTYPKSRNYQNHLHLLSNERITFFVFHELE